MIDWLTKFIYREVIKDMMSIVIKYPQIVCLFQIAQDHVKVVSYLCFTKSS